MYDKIFIYFCCTQISVYILIVKFIPRSRYTSSRGINHPGYILIVLRFVKVDIIYEEIVVEL